MSDPQVVTGLTEDVIDSGRVRAHLRNQLFCLELQLPNFLVFLLVRQEKGRDRIVVRRRLLVRKESIHHVHVEKWLNTIEYGGGVLWTDFDFSWSFILRFLHRRLIAFQLHRRRPAFDEGSILILVRHYLRDLSCLGLAARRQVGVLKILRIVSDHRLVAVVVLSR